MMMDDDGVDLKLPEFLDSMHGKRGRVPAIQKLSLGKVNAETRRVNICSAANDCSDGETA